MAEELARFNHPKGGIATASTEDSAALSRIVRNPVSGVVASWPQQ